MASLNTTVLNTTPVRSNDKAFLSQNQLQKGLRLTLSLQLKPFLSYHQTLLSCSTASGLLCNRTQHSRGFFNCCAKTSRINLDIHPTSYNYIVSLRGVLKKHDASGLFAKIVVAFQHKSESGKKEPSAYLSGHLAHTI